MPNNLTAIQNAVKEIYESVPGYGSFSDQFLIARTEAEVFENFSANPDDRLINHLTCVQSKRTVAKTIGESEADPFEDYEDEAVQREITCVYYYGYAASHNTESVVMNFIEEFINKINDDEELLQTVAVHTKANMESSTLEMFGHILCHIILIKFVTFELRSNN